MKRRSIILLSGGLDSAANLAFCRELDEPILALTVRYGQTAAVREVQAAERLCQYYQVVHRVLDLDWLGAVPGSTVTKASSKSTSSVWVPNRNGVFINVAAAFAESLGAEQVVVGLNSEEATVFSDHSMEYLNRASAILELSTATAVRAFCYTAQWSKRQIFTELQNLSKRFPIESVWSCYEGGPEICRKCESCQKFVRATSFVPPSTSCARLSTGEAESSARAALPSTSCARLSTGEAESSARAALPSESDAQESRLDSHELSLEQLSP